MRNIPIPVLFPIPTDDDDFEDLCVEVLRRYWELPGLERYGSKGQRQSGIDILDLSGVLPLHAAQCKLREHPKTLSIDKIETEVKAALDFRPKLDKYGILTTAKVSTKTQQKILEINLRHRHEGLFEIEFFPWHKICRLIQQYEDIQFDYFGRTVVTATSRIGAKSLFVTQTIALASEVLITPNLTADIDEARDALNRRQFQVCILLLNRLINRPEFGSASAHDRFRVSSNFGLAELNLGNTDAAADHFFQAFEFEPTHEVAQSNEVLAHILRGNTEVAYQKAVVLSKQYPHSTKLATHLVVASGPEVSLDQLELELAGDLKADPEVALALARKALGEMRMVEAVTHAEAASRFLPESPQPHVLIARIFTGWLIWEGKGQLQAPVSGVDLEARIDGELQIALMLAANLHDDVTSSDALSLRTDLRIMQNRVEEAEQDAAEALRLNPDNVQPLLALSQIRSRTQRLDESIQLLERAKRKSDRSETAFLLSQALLQRGLDQDVDLAVRTLLGIDLASMRKEIRPPVTFLAVEALLRTSQIERARKYLASVSNQIREAQLSALQVHIALAEEDVSLAESLTRLAAEQVDDETEVETQDFIAKLFYRLRLYKEALPIFVRLFDLNTRTFEWGVLLDCAARLRRDDIVITTCDTLKERGQDSWKVVQFQVQTLQKYSREMAVARLDEFLKVHEEHKLANLARSVIGYQSKDISIVNVTEETFPSIEELPLHSIVAAIHVLRFAEVGNRTVDYAYRFLKLHFHEIEAHQALILSLFPGDPSISIPQQFDSVGVGTAVAVHDELNDTIRWFVLEETELPNSDFEEISANSPLALELMGKGVGEKVVLVKGALQDRVGTIRQIMSKYVHRCQDSMGEMGVRFGDKSSIHSMRVGTSAEDTTKALQTLLDSVKRRENAIANVRKVYDENTIPLHMLGDQFGENAYVALLSLAFTDGQFIKCSFGTMQEKVDATAALQSASRIVLDLSAIATIRLLDLEHFLMKSGRFQFCMSENTFNELQDTLVGDIFIGASSSTVLHNNGSPSMVRHSVDEKAERKAKDEAFLRRLKESVEIVSVMELASLSEAKREPLVAVVGQYGAETLLLASRPEAVLWTDDLIQTELGKTEFGIKRVWTELLLEQATLAGELEPGDRLRANAAMIGYEYMVVNFDSSVMLKAVNMADGVPWQFPMKQVVDIFRKPSGDLQALMRIFVDFVLRLHREPHLPETRGRIVEALLDGLWMNVALRGAVLQFRQASALLFSINQVGRAAFDKIFDAWLAKQERRIVPGGLLL